MARQVATLRRGILRLHHERRRVDLTFISWNQLSTWLSRLQALQPRARANQQFTIERQRNEGPSDASEPIDLLRLLAVRHQVQVLRGTRLLGSHSLFPTYTALAGSIAFLVATGGGGVVAAHCARGRLGAQ
jgi:hypothetical protein